MTEQEALQQAIDRAVADGNTEAAASLQSVYDRLFGPQTDSGNQTPPHPGGR